MKKFKQYYKTCFKTHTEAAKFFNVSRVTISNYLSGRSSPTRKTIARIAKKTNNAVPVNSWYTA